MVNTGVQRLADQLQFLKVVPLLSKLPDDILAKLSDAFELVSSQSLSKSHTRMWQSLVQEFPIVAVTSATTQ